MRHKVLLGFDGARAFLCLRKCHAETYEQLLFGAAGGHQKREIGPVPTSVRLHILLRLG